MASFFTFYESDITRINSFDNFWRGSFASNADANANYKITEISLRFEMIMYNLSLKLDRKDFD